MSKVGSYSAEVMEAAQAATQQSARLRAAMRALMGSHRAYRKLLLDSDGNLKPEARAVLEDLMRKAQMGLASLELDPQTLARREGMRFIVLHIFGSLKMPEAKLRQLENDLTDIERENQE